MGLHTDFARIDALLRQAALEQRAFEADTNAWDARIRKFLNPHSNSTEQELSNVRSQLTQL